MGFSDFEDYQASPASEKTGLCTLEAAKQFIDWDTVGFGVYSCVFDFDNIMVAAVEANGVPLTEVTSFASLVAGTFLRERVLAPKIYLRLLDSSDPNDSFIGIRFKYFFSNTGVKAPHDLADGEDIWWRPLLTTLSDFRLEVDNKDTQLGLAIEGSGVVRFINDQSFWGPIYDNVFFDNQLITVYAWERSLPITEAQILFRGRIQQKSYTPETIQFQAKDILNELRDVFDLAPMSEVEYDNHNFGTISARVNDNQAEAKQRLIYGNARGVLAMNIDQVLPDTPDRRVSFETGYHRSTDGTFDVTNGSKTVQANGTFRTLDICPGDQILFSNDLEKLYTVDYYTTLSDFLLTENFEGATSTTVTARIFPQRQRRTHNRQFIVAGHELSEVSTTVQQVIDGSHFYVADASEILVGDNVLVTVGGTDYDRVVEAINDTNLITLTVLVSPTPSVGDAVKRPGVQKVYLNSQLLIQGQDYVVDSETAIITLESASGSAGLGSAEFNHTKVETFSGNVTFTNGGLGVSMSSTPHSDGEVTSFTTEFRPGDSIQQPNGTWREVWYVLDDNLLVLAAPATQTADSENGLRKYVNFFQEGTDKLICDVRGRTHNGLTTGSWLRRAPEIVQSILEEAGLEETAGIDEESFENANEEVPFDVALVVPETLGDKKASSVRDAISKLNRSVFGTLLQNSELELAYSVISADKAPLTTFDRSDVVDFSINSDSSKLIKNAVVIYDKREANNTTLVASTKEFSKTSDIGRYLLKLAREFRVETLLIDETAARIMAGRWAFLLELATSRLTTQMKMQGSQLSVGDPVQVFHPKLYDRFGANNIKRRLGSVSLISRGMTKTTMVVDDLSNAFSRVATITDADAEYGDATDAEQVISGYITEDSGVLENDPKTFGLNVIW